jgi:hypothetical protein
MLTQSESEAAFTALGIAQASAASPADASANAGKLVTSLTKVVNGVKRKGSAAYLFTLPIYPAQVVVSSGVVTGIGLTTFQWPENWKVIGVTGTVNEGDSLRSHVFLSLLDQRGQPKFYTSGQNGSAATGAISFQTLEGSPSNPTNYFPVEWYVTQNLQWSYAVTSHDSTGTATYTPEVVFLAEPWDPIADPAPVQSR